RSNPGAAGTVVNNLVALGVKNVCPISVIGDDGEGYELLMALDNLGVETGLISLEENRRTPTYTKPMLHKPGEPPRELNRLDIKNRTPLPGAAEEQVLRALDDGWPQFDALLVLDQVSEAECGVVTTRVRERLAVLGEAQPTKLILADSRQRVGLFRGVSLKPNQEECLRAVYGPGAEANALALAGNHLARQTGRPLFRTMGDKGMWVADPGNERDPLMYVPAYPVSGPVDVVGAGDSSSASIACALAAGLSLSEAAAFGNLVASITIQQIGTTGTATPEQVL